MEGALLEIGEGEEWIKCAVGVANEGEVKYISQVGEIESVGEGG